MPEPISACSIISTSWFLRQARERAMERPITPAPIMAVWMWCCGARVGGVGNIMVKKCGAVRAVVMGNGKIVDGSFFFYF